MNKPSVLVTGANGFIGQALCHVLAKSNYNVRIAIRRKNQPMVSIYEAVEVGEIDSRTQWESALTNVDTVIHLAARVHITKDASRNPLDDFRRINTEGTLHLAQEAAKQGVRRFIFLSTVKVNGEINSQKNNGPIECFAEEDKPNPEDNYALSKWEAEQGLQELRKDSSMEIVILRSPLVYGPGVKANFLSLLTLVKSGMPLPFANIHNKRSFIYIGNLTDIIVQCINNPNVANNTYLVSDGADVPTPILIETIARAMNRKTIMIPFPLWALELLAKAVGKSAYIKRFAGSLCVDNKKIVQAISWKPPFTLETGIKHTVDYYLCR